MLREEGAAQRDLEKLEKWAHVSLMKLAAFEVGYSYLLWNVRMIMVILHLDAMTNLPDPFREKEEWLIQLGLWIHL